MSNGIAYEFPERLNRWITRSNLTEREFAGKLGLPDNVISHWCDGTVLPDLRELRILAFRTNMSADWWLGLRKLPVGDAEVDKLRQNYHDIVHENAELNAKLYDMERRLREAEQRAGHAESEARHLRSTVADRIISVLSEV